MATLPSANDDMMGGNNFLAEARREAARGGYV